MSNIQISALDNVEMTGQTHKYQSFLQNYY